MPSSSRASNKLHILLLVFTTSPLTLQTVRQLVRAQVTRAKLRAETIARRAPLRDAAAGLVWAGEDSDPVLRARSLAVGLSGRRDMEAGGGGGAGGLVGRWGGDCYGPGLQDTLALIKLSAARPRVLWVWGVGCGVGVCVLLPAVFLPSLPPSLSLSFPPSLLHPLLPSLATHSPSQLMQLITGAEFPRSARSSSCLRGPRNGLVDR